MTNINSNSRSDPKVFRESETLGAYLLDSSLIVTTNNLSSYNLKVIFCNDYIQIYKLPYTKTKTNNNLEVANNLKEKNIIQKIDTDNLKRTNYDRPQIIETKNIIRSKLQCQRLAKANAKEWKTFVTLTFADNITDIGMANKKFRNFVDIIQRKFKNFKYICIPEFQKRGAAHYHILTNIEYDNFTFFSKEEKNIWSRKKRKWEIFRIVNNWKHGLSQAKKLDNDIKNIVGYISKYITKDIDNRLYNRHRYFYSRNLDKPKISYLNLNNEKDQEYLKKILNKKELIYVNKYQNSYNDEEIIFEEYL